MRYLSQNLNIGGQNISGPLDSSLNTVGDVVNRIMQFLIPLAAIILLFVLIWGGYDYMMSQGNPEKLKSAQAKIFTGIIGFILLILAFFIVRVIESIFGISAGIL